MAIVTNLPFPTPQQNLKWGWPNISNASNATVQGMNLLGYQNNSAATVPIWLTQFLTGTNLMIMFNRVLAADFNDETVRPIIPYPYIVDDNANIEPLAQVPEQQRYYRIVQWVAQNGNVDNTGEFVFSPASSTSVSFSQLGQPCFGFQADGVGVHRRGILRFADAADFRHEQSRSGIDARDVEHRGAGRATARCARLRGHGF